MIASNDEKGQIIEVTPENSDVQGVRLSKHDSTLTHAERHDPERRMTPKETAYVKYLNDHPTATKREAIRAVYDVKEGVAVKTLDNMAQKIEKRPVVLKRLEEQSERAQELLTTLMEDTASLSKSGTKEGASYAGVAEKVMNSLLDRVHGKPKQSIEMQSTSVSINIDLTDM